LRDRFESDYSKNINKVVDKFKLDMQMNVANGISEDDVALISGSVPFSKELLYKIAMSDPISQKNYIKQLSKALADDRMNHEKDTTMKEAQALTESVKKDPATQTVDNSGQALVPKTGAGASATKDPVEEEKNDEDNTKKGSMDLRKVMTDIMANIEEEEVNVNNESSASASRNKEAIKSVPPLMGSTLSFERQVDMEKSKYNYFNGFSSFGGGKL
jgi:hypothetical protein